MFVCICMYMYMYVCVYIHIYSFIPQYIPERLTPKRLSPT